MNTRPQLRVWWLPQVPMSPAFHVPVRTLREARLLLNALADYDLYQFENRVKGDYANAGGCHVFDPLDDTDGPSGSWVDYWDDDGNEFDDLSDEDIDRIDAETAREERGKLP